MLVLHITEVQMETGGRKESVNDDSSGFFSLERIFLLSEKFETSTKMCIINNFRGRMGRDARLCGLRHEGKNGEEWFYMKLNNFLQSINLSLAWKLKKVYTRAALS